MKLLVFLCAFFAFAASVQAAGTALQTGEDCYLQGDYKAAEIYLHQAVQVDPSAPEGHYWLANSLMKLAKAGQARAEYMTCLNLSPSAQMAQYCQQALDAFDRSSAAQPQVKNDDIPVGNRSVPVEAKHQQTLNRINDRVSHETERLQTEGTEAARKRERDGMEMQERLHEEGEATINQMRHEYYTDINGNKVPVFGNADYQRVRDEYANRGRLALEQAERKAQEALQEKQSRRAGLQDAADGLASQLGSVPSSPNGSMLVPEGTTLYVRNYQAGSADDDDGNKAPVTPLRANPQRSPLLKNAPPAVAQAARPDRKETSDARVEESVRGHLLGGQLGGE